MPLSEMNQKDCRAFLAGASLGRLACSFNDQPYVVPIYFAYEPDFAYVLSTFGQKTEWMHANPKVCLQVDEIADQSNWASVIAMGTYEELPDPEFAEEREHARKLLSSRYQWWLNAMAARQLKQGTDTINPLFFRIKIGSMTGLRASS